jgi:transcriptional regulator with XRE-family HTH domain
MKLIQRVLKEAPFSMRQLAEEAGVGYALVRAWRIGRRAPLPETLRDVAAALRKRGDTLARLADELDREAGVGE